MQISIVIPVFNSEENLLPLHAALVDELQAFEFELILVDDRSQDGSWDIIKQLAHENDNIIGIALRKNAGQDNAIMAGLRRTSGQAVVIMDDDLQHHPRDIPRLYEAQQKGFDVCFANFEHREHSRLKQIISHLNGLAAEVVIGKPPEIYLSPFKIICRDVIDEIVRYDGPFPYVDGLLFQYTDNMTQIDAEHHERFQGSSSTTLWRQFMLFISFVTNFSIVPLRLAAFVGSVVSTLALLLGLFFLVKRIAGGIELSGWTSLMVISLFLGGITLFFIGIIGEYLGRVAMNVNRLPQFTIREVAGADKTSKEESQT